MLLYLLCSSFNKWADLTFFFFTLLLLILLFQSLLLWKRILLFNATVAAAVTDTHISTIVYVAAAVDNDTTIPTNVGVTTTAVAAVFLSATLLVPLSLPALVSLLL